MKSIARYISEKPVLVVTGAVALLLAINYAIQSPSQPAQTNPWAATN